MLDQTNKDRDIGDRNSWLRNATLDSPQQFSDSPEAFDAVFFSGANNQGTYFIIATERRPNNITYGILYVMVNISYPAKHINVFCKHVHLEI